MLSHNVVVSSLSLIAFLLALLSSVNLVQAIRPRQRTTAWFHQCTDDLLQFKLSPLYRDSVFLVQDDVTKAPADAIVNSVGEYCLGGQEGVDLAIHKAMGRTLSGAGLFRQEIVNQLSVLTDDGIRCPLGSARSVRVPWHKHAIDRTLSRTIQYIIQASGPRDQSLAALELTYWSVFEAASYLRVRHVAVPSISTSGPTGIKWAMAAEVAVSTAKLWLDRHPNDPLQIVFYVMADGNLDAYVKAMSELL